MRILLSNHSKQRMIERKISMDELKDAIDMPDYAINKGSKIEAVKKI